MRKGSTRFSNVMRQTGGGGDGILLKSSKKLKTLSSVGEMDTSTCTKNLKLSKKILDDYHPVNHVSVPRKLRSALMKRQHEYVSPSSPSPTNGISRFKMPSEDSNKKLKSNADAEQHLTIPELKIEKITKDEEEALSGLLALARIYPVDNITPEINLSKEILEPEASKSKELVQKCVQINGLNKSINTVDVKKEYKNVSGGNKSRKRCASHVYICRIIKDMQFLEGKMVNSNIQPKTDTSPENYMNSYVGIDLNEAIGASKTIFQDQQRACGVQPYFGNPFCDPSQWSRPVFPKQQMWVNPLIQPHLNSHLQPSMLDVLGSKQQLRYEVQLGQRSSGYQENGSLFRVDNPLTLKLTLQ